MKRGIVLLSRAAAMALLLSAGMIPPTTSARTPALTPPTPDVSTPAAGDAVARYEVRLRKLHLVRPDLIPYPISYDVLC